MLLDVVLCREPSAFSRRSQHSKGSGFRPQRWARVDQNNQRVGGIPETAEKS